MGAVITARWSAIAEEAGAVGMNGWGWGGLRCGAAFDSLRGARSRCGAVADTATEAVLQPGRWRRVGCGAGSTVVARSRGRITSAVVPRSRGCVLVAPILRPVITTPIPTISAIAGLGLGTRGRVSGPLVLFLLLGVVASGWLVPLGLASDLVVEEVLSLRVGHDRLPVGRQVSIRVVCWWRSRTALAAAGGRAIRHWHNRSYNVISVDCVFRLGVILAVGVASRDLFRFLLLSCLLPHIPSVAFAATGVPLQGHTLADQVPLGTERLGGQTVSSHVAARTAGRLIASRTGRLRLKGVSTATSCVCEFLARPKKGMDHSMRGTERAVMVPPLQRWLLTFGGRRERSGGPARSRSLRAPRLSPAGPVGARGGGAAAAGLGGDAAAGLATGDAAGSCVVFTDLTGDILVDSWRSDLSAVFIKVRIGRLGKSHHCSLGMRVQLAVKQLTIETNVVAAEGDDIVIAHAPVYLVVEVHDAGVGVMFILLLEIRK